MFRLYRKINNFQNNDLPGIMLSNSIRSFVNRWGVKSFKKVLLFTNNDDAYTTAINLIDNEDCIGIVDTRDNPKNVYSKIKVYTNSQVINAYGI